MKSSIEDIIYPYMKRGEKLLWEGGAEPVFRWRLGAIIVMGMGGAFIGVPLIALLAGAGGGLWFFFLAIGILLLFFGAFTGWWVRRHSRYALTNLSGFLILDHPISGLQVKRYPITRSTNITKYGAAPASVFFANSERVEVQGLPMRIGFSYIKEADKVYALMRKLQDEIR
ncbi:MAG: hypothetical protein GQ535_17640 [Rhodobacteraceae bacterium]|nr:hypothetical protein [Paracoccaceae bacterium]